MSENVHYDFVNPDHYKQFQMETIDMMIKIWGIEAVITHCEITAFKYKMRLGSKPGQPMGLDIKKSQWYLEKAEELRSLIKTT